MSGGSCGYIYCQINDYLVGEMEDSELNDLMRDVSKLAHDLEWYRSSDIDRESYMKTVKKFKDKWFKGDRNARLKSYVDKELEQTKRRLYALLNVEQMQEEERKVNTDENND